MAKLTKIDANFTGLRFCEETSLKILPVAASQVWYPLEPNSYNNFGTQVKTVARNPINAGRQQKKGTVTGIDVAGGFQTDVTLTNLQRLMQGFFFANIREKLTTAPLNSAPVVFTSVTTGPNHYNAASGLGSFAAGDLVVATGFTNAGNNGLKHVTGAAAGAVTVSETLIAEAAPPAIASLVRVGTKGATSDITITVPGAGALPQINSTVQDFTLLGLLPGEWICVGGDVVADQFATPANNGFARVRAATAHVITVDKTSNTWVADAGTGKTIALYIGHVIRNEQGTSIVRRSYGLERTLGANNDSDLTKQQAEYLQGAIPDSFTLTVNAQSKMTAELTFVAMDSTTIDENVSGANTLLSKVAGATAPAIVEADAFNTSSDAHRINMSVVTAGTPFPTPLFAFIKDLTFEIKNGVKPDLAVGVIGAFEANTSNFIASGKLTAYFADVASVQSVRDNANVTVDAHFVKNNAGLSFDIPLLTLGDGRPNVVQDQAIELPLTHEGGSAARVDPTLNYTMLLMVWNYLPSLA